MAREYNYIFIDHNATLRSNVRAYDRKCVKVLKSERSPFSMLIEVPIAILENCGRTDDGQLAMTKAHLTFDRMS